MKNRIQNILDYYKDHENCDPNVFEYIHLCDDFAYYLNTKAPTYGVYVVDGVNGKDKYPEEYDTLQSFIKLGTELKEKLSNSNLPNKDLLYTICDNCYTDAIHYNRIQEVDLQASVGGVALFIAQKKREVAMGTISEFKYNNEQEFNSISKRFDDAMNNGFFNMTHNEHRNNNREIYDLYNYIKQSRVSTNTSENTSQIRR